MGKMSVTSWNLRCLEEHSDPGIQISRYSVVPGAGVQGRRGCMLLGLCMCPASAASGASSALRLSQPGGMSTLLVLQPGQVIWICMLHPSQHQQLCVTSYGQRLVSAYASYSSSKADPTLSCIALGWPLPCWTSPKASDPCIGKVRVVCTLWSSWHLR